MSKQRRPLKSDNTSYGVFDGDTYTPTRDSGFFSLCSMTLFELSRATFPVNSIDARQVMQHFGQSGPGNPWDHYFVQPHLCPAARFSAKNPFGRRLRHHSHYGSLPIWRVRRHLSRYFSPTAAVLSIAKELIRSNDIDTKRTLVVCYRGTDKGVEIALEDPEIYLQAAKNQLKLKPTMRVWVQTDQSQVRDFLLSELGDRAFAIPEMPTTDGATVIHKTIPPGQQGVFGQTLLATVLLMAQSRYVITHTGNMALWTALFRGHTKRFRQLGLPK